MKQIWIVLSFVLLVVCATGCGRQSVMSVNELLDSGSNYNGQKVTVQGTVSFTISGFLTMIKLVDKEHPDVVKTVTASITGATLDQLGIKDGDVVTASGKYDSENRALDCGASDVKKIQ